MPPATAALSVSLRELADLAIGTPEVGAVNFTALHTLLVAMLKSLNLQETRIDFQSPMLDQSRSFESPRVSTSTPQLVAPKERRRSSVARAQTLETQVKDLGGQVQDLGRQLKTVGSQVQAIVAHVQHFPTQTDGLDDRDWLETKDLALVTQEKGQTGPTKGRSDSKPVFQGPELLQDLMKDMKILKEAHQKKAQPELQPETSESSTGLQRHKRQSSITSSDLIASGVSTKHPSDDQAVDSAGFITDNTFSGSSGIGYPFDGPPGRERSRVSSATGFPAREQHLRARDEAGLARPHPPSMSQLRAEPDRRRSREKHSSGHLRRDERDAHLGPVYQDASLSRDQHPQMSPDQHRGVFASQGHLYARPDQYGFGSFDSDQLELLYPSTYMPGMVPISVDQVGVMLPGMDEQELVVAGMAQSDAVPPLVHGRDQPGSEQPGTVPLSTYQLPGMDESGTDREALVLREMYRQGLQQRGPRPLSTAVGSAPQDQQHLETPEPEQRDQAVPDSIPDSQGLMYGGPGYQGVDQHVQVGVGPKELYVLSQPGVSIQTSPGQEAPVPKSTYSLDYLDRGSSERSDTQSERRESLDKLAPSFPIAVETFRMMGEIIALYMELKENIKDLNEEQAGLTDLEKIQYLLALMVKKSIPPDLQEQLKTLKALTKEIQQEKAKMEKMSKILEGHGEKEIGKEEKGSPLNLQLGVLRVTMADIEKELGELRESQEKGKVSMEHSVSEASIYLQDQLDKLRTIIENMLASSSTLLSMSLNMAPHKPLTTLAPSQIDPAATCPACSLDLSHQVSMLVQRYEQLQNMVSNLAASRPSKKAKLQSQDEELLGHIQSAILQVQGDCEKLSITTSNLIEDRQQKQKDIEVLYQGLEKLEKEKANRGHLEMEIGVKADKSALAGKVSRVQFDATTEQLNRMMQELVAKMTGQEQDWQKMLDKLLVEMDSKLDRLELDPVKQSLEDRWKSLRQQLKERSPLYQADEAAAMRRQLLAHFHCLSCDRPLETPVTGQVIPMTPVGPCLPGHRSVRPYTVFELEQVRQQSRKYGLCRGVL
ncbi:hypothetical protein MJG53_015614 [Ovis ammon polii x Ovis aries]|uniref:Uncharacterized protein n=1 Tax=Ovis ammon polii x Ovis aries TaxID=2918886 RepID=A0ACB9UFP7_9CETA|nr:hypothetical protein MJG53_015614 [Ovis ammon polii x Ovis aries]